MGIHGLALDGCGILALFAFGCLVTTIEHFAQLTGRRANDG